MARWAWRVAKIEQPTREATVTALEAEFGGNVLAGNEIYAKATPTGVPVIDHFVDVSPSECATKAPAEMMKSSVRARRRSSGWRPC